MGSGNTEGPARHDESDDMEGFGYPTLLASDQSLPSPNQQQSESRSPNFQLPENQAPPAGDSIFFANELEILSIFSPGESKVENDTNGGFPQWPGPSLALTG
jgi:hypothetical protein